jgi:hypothetical protein
MPLVNDLRKGHETIIWEEVHASKFIGGSQWDKFHERKSMGGGM